MNVTIQMEAEFGLYTVAIDGRTYQGGLSLEEARAVKANIQVQEAQRRLRRRFFEMLMKEVKEFIRLAPSFPSDGALARKIGELAARVEGEL